MGMEVYRAIRNELNQRKVELVDQILELQYELYPELKLAAERLGYGECWRGMAFMLSQMAEALGQNEVLLFGDYVDWAKYLLANCGIGKRELKINFECMSVVLKRKFPDLQYNRMKIFIEEAEGRLESKKAQRSTYLDREAPCSELAARYLDFVLDGEKHKAFALVHDAVKSGSDVGKIYLHVLQPVQYEVGRLWQTGKVSVALEHYCTALSQTIMSQLYPYTFGCRKEQKEYRFIGSCVSNELHEMGIRMVSDFLEMDGWDTCYLGANMPVADVLKLTEQIKPHVIGLSVTVAVNLSKVENIIREIRMKFGKEAPYIIVGGYPFNLLSDLWRNIGADGHSRNAAEAVELCSNLVDRRKNIDE